MLQAPLGISSETNPVDPSAVRCRSILPIAAFFVVSDASPPRCFAVARPSSPPLQVAPPRRARQLASSRPLLRVPDPPSDTRPPSCPSYPHQAGSVGLPATRLTADATLPYAPEELITPRDTSSTPHRDARLPDQNRLQRAVLLLDGSSVRAFRSSTAEAISTPQNPALRSPVRRAIPPLPKQLPFDLDRLQGFHHRRVRCADLPLPARQHPILPWVLFPSEARPAPPLTPSRVARHSTVAFDGAPPREVERAARLRLSGPGVDRVPKHTTCPHGVFHVKERRPIP